MDALTTVSWVNSLLETISPTLKEGFLVLAIVCKLTVISSWPVLDITRITI